MLFSKSCEYGLRSMIYLASADGKSSLQEICKLTELPLFYLSKIFQKLVKAKLVESFKGPTGGYRLVREPHEVTLSHIVQAIDGLDSIHNCGIGLTECNMSQPCCIHHEYSRFQRNVVKLFSNKTLEDIIYDYSKGKFEALY